MLHLSCADKGNLSQDGRSFQRVKVGLRRATTGRGWRPDGLAQKKTPSRRVEGRAFIPGTFEVANCDFKPAGSSGHPRFPGCVSSGLDLVQCAGNAKRMQHDRWNGPALRSGEVPRTRRAPHGTAQRMAHAQHCGRSWRHLVGPDHGLRRVVLVCAAMAVLAPEPVPIPVMPALGRQPSGCRNRFMGWQQRGHGLRSPSASMPGRLKALGWCGWPCLCLRRLLMP
jgi:hypothetical protein